MKIFRRKKKHSNFIMRNMTDSWFGIEWRCSKSIFIIFFLIELKHISTEIIPIDPSGFLCIELDQERERCKRSLRECLSSRTLSNSFSSNDRYSLGSRIDSNASMNSSLFNDPKQRSREKKSMNEMNTYSLLCQLVYSITRHCLLSND